MYLDSPIESLPNTSSVTIRRLKLIGIHTYWDLLNFFPFRYENYSLVSTIHRLQNGEAVTVIGKIIEAKQFISPSGLRIQQFLLSDNTGKIRLLFYNQSYLLNLLKPNTGVAVAGTIEQKDSQLILKPKEYEPYHISVQRNELIHTGRIIPVYSEKKGLSSKTIRDKIWTVLKIWNTPEVLPNTIVSYNNLLEEGKAYREIHYPSTLSSAERAKERLSFDELFLTQLNSQLVKAEWEKETVGNRFTMDNTIKKKLEDFISRLPFKLTNAQKGAVNDVLADLQMVKPMNRILQGEVGSGKTVIAAIACYYTHLNGFQSLIMAPTEILAEQHFKTITDLFNLKSKISNYRKPNICLITGSKKPTQKERVNADIIIGTHALFQKNIFYRKVGLLVIDEQHRFGVAQRAELKNKGVNPHLLTMTATPIPRTVMLTLYGELDLSILDEMPIGRLPIKTYFISQNKRHNCYEWIKKQIKKTNAQVYIICPLIEESEVETLQSIKAAKKEYEHLKKEIFESSSLGLLHGKLTSKEKNKVMEDFKKKKYNILVSTPVVEVGIDVPSATIMIVEGAERFGLAQLHQLRGRIGRGDKQSYCFAFSEKENSEISTRLSYFTKTQEGNTLAQKDLELRGPGNLYGVKQHGFINLKIASLSDYEMIEKTKNAVGCFMKHYNLDEYPELKKRVEELKVEQITKD